MLPAGNITDEEGPSYGRDARDAVPAARVAGAAKPVAGSTRRGQVGRGPYRALLSTSQPLYAAPGTTVCTNSGLRATSSRSMHAD